MMTYDAPLVDLSVPAYMTATAHEQLRAIQARAMTALESGQDFEQFAQNLNCALLTPKSVNVHGGIYLPTGEETIWGTPKTYDWEYLDGVALLNYVGPVMKRSSIWSWFFNIAVTDRLARHIQEAYSHPAVDNLRIYFDTPGGDPSGLPEVANLIRSLRGKGKVIAGYCDHHCASAGYFIMAACERTRIAPNALVGSIGSVYAWIDDTEAMKAAGLKEMVIANVQSPKKYLLPHTKEGQAELQRLANEGAEIFASSVAESRNVSIDTVWKDFGQGSMLTGEFARTAGMVDEVGDESSMLVSLGAPGVVGSSDTTNNDGDIDADLDEGQSMHIKNPHAIAALKLLGYKDEGEQAPAPGAAAASAAPALPATAAPDARDAQIAELQRQLNERTQADATSQRATDLSRMTEAMKSKLPPAAHAAFTTLAEQMLDGKATTQHLEALLTAIPAAFAPAAEAPDPKTPAAQQAAPAVNPEDVSKGGAVDEAYVATMKTAAVSGPATSGGAATSASGSYVPRAA